VQPRLTTVRRVGYGTSLEETERGVHGLGVSLHAPSGRVIAALTTAVPSVRFRRQDAPAYVEGLRAGKAALEDALAQELPG
jgi:DNA-binding IclR family transcriptional regulator